MMKVFTYTLFLMFLLTSTDGYSSVDSNLSYPEMATIVRAKSIKEIQKKTPLRAIGMGSSMMDQIDILILSFEHKGILPFEEGKKLVVLCANTLINNINEYDEIQPYLANRPFGYKNIEITIFVRSSNGSDTDPGEISVISLVGNKIKYKDHTQPFGKTLMKEESLLVDQTSSPEPIEPPKSSD